jgi:hypothetical protein
MMEWLQFVSSPESLATVRSAVSEKVGENAERVHIGFHWGDLHGARGGAFRFFSSAASATYLYDTCNGSNLAPNSIPAHSRPIRTPFYL